MTTSQVGTTMPFCNETVSTVEEKIALKQDVAACCDTHVGPLQQSGAAKVTITADMAFSIGTEGKISTCFSTCINAKPTDFSASEMEEAHISPTLGVIVSNACCTSDTQDDMTVNSDTTFRDTISSTSDTVAFPADGTPSVDSLSNAASSVDSSPAHHDYTVHNATFSATFTSTPSTAGATSTGTPSAAGATPTGTPSTAGATSTGTPSTAGATSTGTPSTAGATPTGTPSTAGATSTGTPSTAGATSTGTPSTAGATSTGTPSTAGATSTGTPSTAGATSTGTPSTAGATPTASAAASVVYACTPATSATPNDTSVAGATPTGTPSTAGATPIGTLSADGTTSTGTPSTAGATSSGTPSTAGATSTGIPSTVGATSTGTPSTAGATSTGTPSTVGATPTGTPSTAGATSTGTPSTAGATPTGTPSTVGATPTGTPSTAGATSTGTPSTAGATSTGTPSTVGATPTGTPSTIGATPTGTPSTAGATSTGTPSTAGATSTGTPSTAGATSTGTPSTAGATSSGTPSTAGATSTGTPSTAGATSTGTPSTAGATSTGTPSTAGATSTGTPSTAGATSTGTPSADGTTSIDPPSGICTSAAGATSTNISVLDVASDFKDNTSNSTQQSALAKNTANQDARLYHCKGKDDANDRSKKESVGSHLSLSEKDCVLVTFHVIIPTDLWGWDEYSCVHLCFGHKLLGGWKSAHGEFSMRYPSSAESNCEMICTLPIKMEILKDPLPYKYRVFSPKVNVQAKNHCYEFLYGHSKNHGHNNRCLVNKHSEIIAGKGFDQYDTVAYPCEAILASVMGGQSEGTVASKTDAATPWYHPANVFKAISSALSYATKKEADSSVAPSHEDTSLCSLSVYLRPYAEALCKGSYTSSLAKIVDEINRIYSFVSCPHVINGDGVKTNPLQLSQAMQQHFISILESLQSTSHETQLCSAVAVMFCVSEGVKYYQLKLPLKVIASALKMIRLMPCEHKRTCSEIAILDTLIPEESRHAVGEAILQFCFQLFISGKHQLEWFEALPLVHFLKGSSKPFALLPRPKQLQWVHVSLQQQIVGKYEIDDIVKHYHRMQDLFALDPLLLPLFINMCPKKTLMALFKCIPPYVSTAYASYVVSKQGWSQAEVDECSMLVSAIRSNKEGHCATSEQLLNMLESFSMLLNEIILQIKNANRGHSAKLPHALILLILETVSSYQNNSGAQSDIESDTCLCFTVLNQLVSLLESWITCKDVMGELFGGKEITFYSSWKGKEELMLWDEILKHDCMLRGKVLDKWNALRHDLIQKRVQQLSDKGKVKLVCYLEESANMHPLLVEVVFNNGAKGIDSICDKGGDEAVSQINELVEKESERIGKLTSQILIKKYPNSASNIYQVSFDDLMNWEFWPCFIKIYCGKPTIKKGLKHPCITACKAAVDRLNFVCGQLATAEILVKELLKINDKKSVMKLLCEAAVISVAVVQSDIEGRMEELKHYRSHCDLLRYFLSKAQIPEQTLGLPQLTEELKRDISDQKLKTICTRNQHSEEVEAIFPAAGALNVFVDKFHIMTSDYPSSIFDTFWKYYLSLKTDCTVNFSYLHTDVWNPTLNTCRTIVNQCRMKSITLNRVDALLKHLELQGVLEVELTNLSQGCALRHGTGWVQDTCALMRNYWMLCCCRSSAALVLDLKEAMHLKGNFQDVDMISKGVENAMKTSELGTISEELIKTGQFLKSITSDKEKESCLRTFLECLDVREWLRTVTKGVTELNRFVTIALSTGPGGEDALTQDKLSNLRTIGSGFAPLIYTLSENVGFNEFSMQCTQVWKALESNKDLPSFLKNCKTCLSWYKHVREIQGSVEESSFAQLDAIHSHGWYVVGLSPQCSMEDVVNVKIITRNDSLPKMRYNLDELKDLESRLILITSCKAKDRDKVDLYTDTLHSIVRIAEVLMKLNHEGNATYSEWTLKCQCKASPDFDCKGELQRLACVMEQGLQDWRQELKRARDTYYALNYYTNAQLLVLRENLTKLPCPTTVLDLLRSISPRVTGDDVCNCLQEDISECDGLSDSGHGSLDFDQPVMTRRKEFTVSVCQDESPLLTLQKLGIILQSLCLRLPGKRIQRQAFSNHYVPGSPNLIVVNPSQVLKTVLSLYMCDMTSPLPAFEEVLLCDQHTSEEEVFLLLRRSIGDPEYGRIFCLAHAERLSFQVADNVLKGLDEIIQGHLDYRLVIVCGAEAEGDSHIVTKLQQFHRPNILTHSDKDIIHYLRNWFGMKSHKRLRSVRDRINSCVQVVSSTRCGMGKSLYVCRIKESIRGSDVVCVPMHGPAVTSDTIMNRLLGHTSTSQSCTIFHLDIDPSVLHQVDSLLFSLLVLKGLTDSHGHIWRCLSHDIYVVEVTFPVHEGNAENAPVSGTQVFLSLLPSVQCLSPLECIRANDENSCNGVAMIDTETFQSEDYQLVSRCLASYHSVPVPKSQQDQLRLFVNCCGLRDPTWSEIAYFTSFLAVQQKACENSVFCSIIDGLNNFAVKFMIRMSRDFSTPSLHGEFSRVNEEQQQIEEEDTDDILRYQIEERKKWEQSSHPYLFFNGDGHSITFVGFVVTPNGDLVDPGREAAQMGNAEVSAGDCGILNQGYQHPGQSIKNQAWYSGQGVRADSWDHQYTGEGYEGHYSGQTTREVRYSHSMSAQTRPHAFVGTQCIIEKAIMSPDLFRVLKHNKVNFNEDYRIWRKDQMIEKIGYVMGCDYYMDPDPSYALTADNLIKILAIQMRFRCGIPVVIMGESGCGKTRLIQYMCDLAAQSRETRNIFILKVHGGTNQKDIIDCIEDAEKMAETNQTYGLDTVVFFDEANTTEAIGLIKEIMCDRRMNGRTVSNALKFIAACNPYRRHSDEMIKKLESAGLGFYVHTNQTQEQLGKVPLRHLVYRVLELLPSMRSLVYDFGQLNSKTETDYIVQIVKNHAAELVSKAIQAIAAVLSWSQQYMKEQTDECSYVSLRDVKRAMIVFDYFYNRSPLFNELHPDCMDKKQRMTHSLVMALAVCYHARLTVREDYETKVCAQFKPPLNLQGGTEQFRSEITRTQNILLANMEVGLSIAHNAALRENVFMMAICIELRIPLFLVGKPGSSKSLAKSIISSSMLGRGSAKSLLNEFKEVYMASYQCSQHSTAESIIDVFKTAEKFQVNQDPSQFVSVVVLDEVGLAEDSPHLPLKALHPLLEDGTQDNDTDVERVAFIGISNWALDPAKMNRGVMLTRGQPDIKELVESAWGICSDQKDNAVIKQLGGYFESLAQAYQDVCRENTLRDKEFFGLRDFYSLIKMLYSMCIRKKRLPMPPELENAIRRNFGGKDGYDPTVVFKKRKVLPTRYYCNAEDRYNNSLLGMIRSSLATKDSALNGDSRYLLFLTENYAALKILFHYMEDAITTYSSIPPFILFGSSFPKDNEYTQICQNVNQIKLCMETGRTAILLNLEILYESLYDALNQYYIHYGGKRYVDLGLKTHKVKCFIHENFKLILIAEKQTVYEKFPIPLISRLEKHFVVTSSVFCEWQNRVLKMLEEWTKKISEVDDYENSSKFTEEEAFVGYQKDTPAALIFQATNHCQKMMKHRSPTSLMHSTASTEEEEELKTAVLLESQQLLLQTVSPDAIVRVQETVCMEYGEIQSNYFQHLYSPSLFHYLRHQTTGCNSDDGCKMIQVTTHSYVLSHKELNDIAESLNMHAELLYLHQFQTECDFSAKIRSVFERKISTNDKQVLLLIQCESGHQKGDLIACARYRINDEKIKANQQMPNPPGRIYVVLIIYLPRQTSSLTFVGFQGEPWVSVHIDDLRPINEDITSLNALRSPISVLFHSCSTSDGLVGHPGQGQYHKRLHGCIQPSVAKLQGSAQNHNKGAKLVAILLDFIPKDPPLNIDELPLYKAMVKHVHTILQQMEEVNALDANWAVNVARSRRQLQQGGTLRNTLIRKIDKILVPIFAHIIAVTNQYDNLALFHSNEKQSAVGQLWLAMFGDPQIVQFKYADIVTAKDHNDGIGSSTQFQCQFPFFWLVKETIESSHDNTKKALGMSEGDITDNLIVQVLSSPIGAILSSVSKADQIHIYKRYLQDYVACVYKSMQKDTKIEQKLVSDALNGLVQKDWPLVKKLSTLHIAYQSNRSCLMWFGNLVFCVPSILESLESRISPWMMAVHAVRLTVDSLNPSFHENENISEWLQQVQHCLVSVETILSEYPYDDITELRCEWHCIRAIQMFLEHVGLKHKGMVTFAEQLYKTIGRAPHFGKASTIAKVKCVLETIDSSNDRNVEESCHKFFIELVSQLCFRYESPDKDLIKLLFDTIFTSKLGGRVLSTGKLSYKMEKDTVPVIRSCLLQLLLNLSSDAVREYLQQYLVKSEQVIGRNESDKCQLYLLCIKCFQDTLHAKHENKSLQERAGIASHMLEVAYGFFLSHRADNSLEYIEAVAHTRYGLVIAREALYAEVTHPESTINPALLTAVKKVCTHPIVNQLDDKTANGPIIFLLKEFAKRYGMSLLKQASQRHSWLLPPQLKTTKEDSSPDMFMVHGDIYRHIRDLVADAVYCNKFQQLQEALNDPDISCFLNLALYEIVLLDWQRLKQLPKAIESVRTIIKQCKHLTTNMRNMATFLLQDPNNLFLSCVTSQHPYHRLLLSVVVHTAAVMFSKQNTSLLLPFVTMLTNPTALADCYMPTMPDDILSKLGSALAGKYYECPNGHPYLVTECGKPMQKFVCPVCNEDIGGVDHQPAARNVALDMQQRGDRSQRGYALPNPDKRSSNPAPERQLSAIACCLIRILMHSTLFWTSNSNLAASEAVRRLMKCNLSAPQLLLLHLEKDLETLTRAVKKNEVESSALVHAVLQHIFISRCSQESSSHMETSDQRSQWEQSFQNFVSPVLKNMEQTVKIAMSSILSDDKKEYGRLMYIVHEKSTVDHKDLQNPKAHAWAYHPILSLENVESVFQAQNLRSVCPILHKFLQQERVLKATQCIPDIFRLQQLLHNQFNHRLDHTEASSKSIGDFLKQVPEHRLAEVKRMLQSLNKAWSLCKDLLPPRDQIPEQLASFTSKTPLEYLIPMASGVGKCTTLLLNFLVCAHNTFLEECRIAMEEISAERWPRRQIPVAYVQQLHTLNFEAQLHSIVTSHCQYSLMTGQGHDVQYDFPGLEKSLVDHFIHGKPLILLEIPCVAYRRDIRSVEQFNKINETLHPQMKLSAKVQREILGELGSTQQLRESLDTLETVMAFLAPAVGVSVNMKLSTFAENLKMQFSSKIQQHCQLSHVLSLWETMSIALAVQHVMRKQEPFDGINGKSWCQKLTVPQTKKLKDVLGHFKLDNLVVGLFQLISTYIRNALQHDHSTSIIDGMQVFKDIYLPDKDPIPLFTEQFPKDLTLGQAIETWKYIVEYQNRVEPHTLM